MARLVPDRFDFLVLGGGSGGIAAARRAARHGARVGLVEGGALGGTCVNRGCVPKKVMWLAAEAAEWLRDAGAFGFEIDGEVFHDWGRLARARDLYVKRLNEVYRRNLESAGVHLLDGWGRFAGRDQVLAGDSIYQADKILIATGGRPVVPDVPGAELGLTSDGVFALEERPGRVAIAGAGYIAAEMASMLRGLDSEVTIFLRKDELLRRFDATIREGLRDAFEEAGIEILGRSPIAGVEREGPEGLLTVVDGNGHRHPGFEAVLFAVGRAAATSGLGLELAGVETDAAGRIPTDEYERTSNPDIFAVGDVNGKAELTPVAIAAGRAVADRLFGGNPEAKVDYSMLPTVVFTHPPIGTMGLTEEAAIERYGRDRVRVHESRFVNMAHATTARKPTTRMKLVTTGPEERIVGLHAIGRGADEFTQGFAVALTMGATKGDFDRTMAIHPTAAEEFVTMG